MDRCQRWLLAGRGPLCVQRLGALRSASVSLPSCTPSIWAVWRGLGGRDRAQRVTRSPCSAQLGSGPHGHCPPPLHLTTTREGPVRMKKLRAPPLYLKVRGMSSRVWILQCPALQTVGEKAWVSSWVTSIGTKPFTPSLGPQPSQVPC